MTNWTTLVSKLNKLEKDVVTWKQGLADAEGALGEARAEMAAALGLGGGSAHKAPPAAAVKVAPRRTRHDYQRRARVLVLVKAKGGFVTTGDVVKAEGIRSNAAASLLSRLTSEGKLSRVAKGRYSQPAAEAE